MTATTAPVSPVIPFTLLILVVVSCAWITFAPRVGEWLRYLKAQRGRK